MNSIGLIMRRNLSLPVALFVACLGILDSTQAQQGPTKAVVLKFDADLKDPALEFILDEREIPAKTLQAPVQLKYGSHELLVLRDGNVIDILQFEIGPNTEAEV